MRIAKGEKASPIQAQKDWNTLLDESLPDEKLTKLHNEGLDQKDAKNAQLMNSKYKYLELGYKLKGRLQPEIQNNTLVLQDAEIQAKAMAFIERLTAEPETVSKPL